MLTHIDTPLSISLADHLTPEEREELVQTVEALKAFTETNPDDDQSLEILKDAYWRLGQQAEGLVATRKLADAYLRQGQYSAALLEYEGILVHGQDNPEVQAIIAELDAKLNPDKPAEIALDFGLPEESEELPPDPGQTAQPALIATADTRMPATDSPTPASASIATAAPLVGDANEPLARFLIQHRMASREIVEAALQRVRTLNAEIEADPNTPSVAAGLLEEVIKAGVEPESLLCSILDRTKIAYAPLDHYDIDRQIVKMLPESITLGRRVVPFDLVSRTLMVAIDNPFDSAVKTLVQQSVDYHVQWHLTMPAILHRILREVYRLPA